MAKRKGCKKAPKINPHNPVDWRLFEGVGNAEIHQLTNQSCHWPYDGLSVHGRRTYCGAPTEKDRHYCPFHVSKAFKKKKPKGDLQSGDDFA